MQIETRGIPSKSPSRDENELLEGFFFGKDIYLLTQNFSGTFPAYLHEVGHRMGARTSFFINTLSPQELTSAQIELDSRDLQALSVNPNTDVKMENERLRLANKLLSAFFKGRFNPKQIRLYHLSLFELENKWDAIDTENEPDKKEVRNMEIDAYYTQACCLKILENTLKTNKVPNKHPNLFVLKEVSSEVHQKAQNIVAWALRNKIVLPSTFDIKSRDDNNKLWN